MRKSSIVTAGVNFLILSGIANASELILRVDIATQVDMNKVEEVGIQCYAKGVHGVIGQKYERIPLNDDGSFYGRLDVTIEPLGSVSGVADMLANTVKYKCNYRVFTARGEMRDLQGEANIPRGLETYWGRGGRPFRPTASGPVVW